MDDDMVSTNTFEGGTDTVNVSTSNSGGGSGDAIDLLVIGGAVVNGGNTNVIYSTSAAIHGSLGCRMTLQSSTTYLRWDTSGGELRQSARRSWQHQVPSGQAVITGIYDSSQSRLGVAVGTDGKPVLTINNNGTTITASKPAAALTVGQKYYIEGTVKLGNGDGEVGLHIWDNAGALIHSYTDTGLSVGTNSVEAFRLGTLSSSSGFTYDYLDEVKVGPLASGYFGPPASPIEGTPTDNGPLWQIDATGLTGGLGSLTHSISPSSGVVETSEGIFWVPQNETETTYTITSTDGADPVTNDVVVPAQAVGGSSGLTLYWTGSEWL